MRIQLHNIGPLKDADIEFLPLTVLIGPNGSGKTTVSTIAYAATRAFTRAVRATEFALMRMPSRRRESEPTETAASAVAAFEDQFRESLDAELRRCCTRDLTKLAREYRAGRWAAPRVIVSNGGVGSASSWTLVFKLHGDRVTLDRQYPGYVPPSIEPVDPPDAGLARRQRARSLRRGMPRNSVYFPASRSGLMQTYGALTALVWGALGGGFFEEATVGTIPGTTADFLQFLARIRPDRSSSLDPQANTLLETGLLQGSLSLSRGPARPEVTFRPAELTQDWPIEEVATSVAELAPLVLYLRHEATSGDAIFIDEPEAHFHPRNQVIIARALVEIAAQLSSVTVATHSEFVASELSNQLLEGQLTLNPSLDDRRRRIAVYEFSFGDVRTGCTTRRLELDSETGFEVDQFASVADATFERGVELFNRIHKND
jgi:predicted ATPase